MYKTRFLIGFLVFVILAILLAVGGYALHQLGYSQGYATSLSVSAAEEGAALIPHQAVPALRYYGHIGYGGFSRPLLLCFAGSAFLLAIFMILKTIRFLTWRSMVGADPEKWHRHWRRHYQHAPPWWNEDDESKPSDSDPGGQENPRSASTT
jgi:hypothetical protein